MTARLHALITPTSTRCGMAGFELMLLDDERVRLQTIKGAVLLIADPDEAVTCRKCLETRRGLRLDLRLNRRKKGAKHAV